MQNLFDLHNPDGPERCGVIFKDGSVQELPNVHPSPLTNFALDAEILEDQNVTATWHTHPTTGPNLSSEDYKSFIQYPQLKHYIISEFEIWCFGMESDILLKYDDNHLTRLPKKPSST